MSTDQVVMLIVFVILFALVTVLGFFAARWRSGDLSQLHEWGLAGRRFGTVVTWFLLGGDLYTAYTFIAVPAALFGAGVAATGPLNFFAVPYTIIAYPIVFLFVPRLWSVAKKHGFITTSDFVRGRFDSRALALAVAFTGILATMPYIALQLVGMQVVLAAMGLQFSVSGAPPLVNTLLEDLPLIIAFVILALYTYSSGLRAPAMIALVKDALIFITVIAAVIIIPAKLGGFGHIFAAVPPAKLTLAPPAVDKLGQQNFGQFTAFATLALGSALALFLYPHAVTGSLAANSRNTIKRNAALLPAYSFVLGLIALLGFMAIAAGVSKNPAYAGLLKQYGNNAAVPALFLNQFPAWFVGVAFAAIAIGALVPAAVMSIAAANLFTRNIYKEFFRPNASPAEEAQTAKLTSLVIKLGALLIILFVQVANAIDFQLLGGVWIIQTLPSVVLGLFTRWFHRWALLIGWAVGMVVGTAMVVFPYGPSGNLPRSWTLNQHVAAGALYHLHIGNFDINGYAALYAVLINIVVSAVLSLVFNLAGAARGKDATSKADYTTESAPAEVAVVD
jgi:SSS family solute:Na+ symporter